MVKKAVRKVSSVEKGAEVVTHQHTGTPRIRAWVACKLQPAQYNSIEVGFSVEEDIGEKETHAKAIKRVGAVALSEFDKQVKAAFKSLGFEY